LALESTRVKLFVPLGCEALICDYINANFINIQNKNYIACQAPLPWTIIDFWKMIWEQKSKIIIMLTKIVEGGRVKAHPYWPEYENEIKRYAQFHVSLLRTTAIHGIIKRRFKIEDISQHLQVCDSISVRRLARLWYSHDISRNIKTDFTLQQNSGQKLSTKQQWWWFMWSRCCSLQCRYW